MTFDYLFEATPKWENAIDRGLLKSSESFLPGCYLLMNFTGIAYMFGHYPVHSAKPFAGLLAFLCMFLFSVVFSSYYVLRLCDETRDRLRSGFIDPATRRTLLNVSYMGYRLYLILLLIPAIILLAVQSVHP
jgi:hypothetical protein